MDNVTFYIFFLFFIVLLLQSDMNKRLYDFGLPNAFHGLPCQT